MSNSITDIDTSDHNLVPACSSAPASTSAATKIDPSHLSVNLTPSSSSAPLLDPPPSPKRFSSLYGSISDTQAEQTLRSNGNFKAPTQFSGNLQVAPSNGNINKICSNFVYTSYNNHHNSRCSSRSKYYCMHASISLQINFTTKNNKCSYIQWWR